ncbi:MAG TPA: glycosyltransferase family 39 protein [Bryobacteraceae bacterium]
MIAALKAILGAALTAWACYAAGSFLIGRLKLKLERAERFPLAFVLGAACLHLAVFVLLALHLAYWPVLVLLLLGAILSVRLNKPFLTEANGASESNRYSWRQILLWVALFGGFSVLYFFDALAPEGSPDGSSYHLAFVARYLRAHGFERITTNMYAALSQGIEMLFVPAFAIGKHSAAALLHFVFLMALALAIFAYGRRIGKPWAGVAAAFLVYASPVVGIDSSSAYIDVAVAAVVFSVFYWLEIWDETRADNALIPVGLLAGFSYAAKYPAAVALIYALGFVLWRSRSLKPALRIAALSAIMILPWMVKDWIVVGNPVAPFANQIFRNPNFHVITIQQWADYMSRYEIQNLWTLPLEVTVRGQKTQGLIGPVFLLAPLGLLSLRFATGRRLLAMGALLLATYLYNVGARFLIPELPFFALALVLALGNSPGLIAALAIFHAASSWPAELRDYATPGAWRLDRVLYKPALRKIPEDKYLRSINPGYSYARMVDAYVPKGERVFSVETIATAYTNRDILVEYECAFCNLMMDILNNGWVAAYQPRVLEQLKFPERTARRIRIEQNALGRPLEQWSVHELRFFDRGAELPRRPQWRLSAWPNPWDVQLAFDDSPATRWRTWERAAPGDYIQVDFGQAQAVDEVRIERSYDYNLQADVKIFDDSSGRWMAAGASRETTAGRPDANIRRYATRELALRGIHYVLITDNAPGAFDFRGDPQGWGMEKVVEEPGAHLYRIVP